MAKDTLNRKFTNAILDLENMTLTEMPKKNDKNGVEKEFDLMTELARFTGDDKRIDITITEASEHLPSVDEE